jgi:hypothetical protein
LSRISQNLDNFYQIQTNHYHAHLMRTVAYCSESGLPDLGTVLALTAHRPYVRVLPRARARMVYQPSKQPAATARGHDVMSSSIGGAGTLRRIRCPTRTSPSMLGLGYSTIPTRATTVASLLANAQLLRAASIA